MATTITAIAELIHDQINPGGTDEPYIDFENVVEEVTNTYIFLVWQQYMQNVRSEGERSAYDALLRRVRIPVAVGGSSSLELEEINIVTLPKDEGLVNIIPVKKNGQASGLPFSKTNSGLAYMPSRIDEGWSYYRIDKLLTFPEGMPADTVEVEVHYMGLPEDEELLISRDMAQMVKERVLKNLLETRSIPADQTNNSNSNV